MAYLFATGIVHLFLQLEQAAGACALLSPYAGSQAEPSTHQDSLSWISAIYKVQRILPMGALTPAYGHPSPFGRGTEGEGTHRSGSDATIYAKPSIKSIVGCTASRPDGTGF